MENELDLLDDKLWKLSHAFRHITGIDISDHIADIVAEAESEFVTITNN
jgi:hypothetical protein